MFWDLSQGPQDTCLNDLSEPWARKADPVLGVSFCTWLCDVGEGRNLLDLFLSHLQSGRKPTLPVLPFRLLGFDVVIRVCEPLWVP